MSAQPIEFAALDPDDDGEGSVDADLDQPVEVDPGLAYMSAGWEVVPLPKRKKADPYPGTTGVGGVALSAADYLAVREAGRFAGGNIGIRSVDGTAGLDFDCYKAEGLETLEKLTERCGPLPPTWRSSARDDDPNSGIRWYRVPVGLHWKSEPEPGFEMVQRTHRYGVVWPSVHPEGMTYRWYRPDGSLAEPGEVPRADDLPDLPSEWVAELEDGPERDEVAGKPADVQRVKEFLRDLSTVHFMGEWVQIKPCRVMVAAADRKVAELPR